MQLKLPDTPSVYPISFFACWRILFNPQNRLYQGIWKSYQNQDYQGLVLGDVDGNWQTSNPVSLKTLVSNSILPDRLVVLINSRISIPLKIGRFEGAESVDIQVLYDPSN